MRSFFAAALLLLFVTVSSAQNVGVVELDSIIQHLPDTRTAQAKLDSSVSFLQAVMQQIQDSIELVMLGYPEQGPVSLKYLQERQQKLDQCNDRIQQFQVDARAGLIKYRDALYAPIVDKAKKICAMYAKANRYTAIVDKKSKDTAFLYGKPIFYDITKLVIAKIESVQKH